MGIKIIFSLLAFGSGLWLSFIGFYRAGYAIEFVFNRAKAGWFKLFFGLGLIFSGAGLSAGILTVWIDAYG